MTCPACTGAGVTPVRLPLDTWDLPSVEVCGACGGTGDRHTRDPDGLGRPLGRHDGL